MRDGVDITADAHQAWAFVSRLYQDADFNFATIEAWLRDNTRSRR